MTSDATARRHSVFHRLKVKDVQRLTADAVAVTFDVPPELSDAYAFVPGQHINVAMPNGDDVRRSYSICSSPADGRLRIAVKRIPEGTFSAYAIDKLAPGDELDVMTPAGRFTPDLDPAADKHYVAIAAGSGITPVMSIAAAVLETEAESRVTLLYGNRTSQTAMFIDELADLKDRFPGRFHLIHVLSREAQDAELLSGRIDAEKLRRFLGTLIPPDTADEWYLCGPYDLVTSARDVLVERGVDPSHIHSELFHVGEIPPAEQVEIAAPSEGSEIAILLDGRQTNVTISDGETVLDAVLRVRNDAPFACRGGVCGTCRAKVLDGAVAMERNFALEDDEVTSGYVLTCQAHPTTERVSLDYDA
jgi:ring-1,2-phenylacetyl-CoA epoxidase subunit PaaE